MWRTLRDPCVSHCALTRWTLTSLGKTPEVTFAEGIFVKFKSMSVDFCEHLTLSLVGAPSCSSSWLHPWNNQLLQSHLRISADGKTGCTGWRERRRDCPIRSSCEAQLWRYCEHLIMQSMIHATRGASTLLADSALPSRTDWKVLKALEKSKNMILTVPPGLSMYE